MGARRLRVGHDDKRSGLRRPSENRRLGVAKSGGGAGWVAAKVGNQRWLDATMWRQMMSRRAAPMGGRAFPPLGYAHYTHITGIRPLDTWAA